MKIWTGMRSFKWSTSTNVALRKKTEFYKKQSDCEEIAIAAWDLGQSPSGVSRGKAPQIVGF